MKRAALLLLFIVLCGTPVQTVSPSPERLNENTSSGPRKGWVRTNTAEDRVLRPRSLSSPGAAGDELIVDGSIGSDSNSGTEARPLKTVGKAAQLALVNHHKNIPVTITIRPGIYRESIEIQGSNPENGAPITFQASKIGTVIISGSDVWTGWQPDPDIFGQFFHSWPYQWGVCGPPKGFPALKDIVLRREMIFVDGKPLTQVLSRAQMSERSFFIDEAGKRAYLWPSTGTDMTKALVEVAVREKLLESHRNSNLVLRGLVFQHANPCVSMRPAAAVAIFNGSNELVEDSTFNWNNWIGFLYNNVTNSAARRIVANFNGGVGMVGFRFKGVTIENVQTSHNNWRGELGQFRDWEPAGGKFFHVHGAVFKHYVSVENQARGLWFDTDNADVTIDHAFLARNQTDGLFLEANEGPFTIKNSQICSNGGAGILTNHTAAVSLVENVIYDNHESQVFVNGKSKQRSGSNWETGSNYVVTAQNWSFLQNVIVGVGVSQLLFGTVQSSSESSALFFSTLNSRNNSWYNAANRKVFQLDPGGPGHQPRSVDFSEWRSATRQDKDSTFSPPQEDPARTCAAQ
jgi:hypothetical protein